MKYLITLTLITLGVNCLAQNCACCDSLHTQFDFWVGDWEVKDKQGQIVGHNSITKLAEGCVLQEQWEGVKGSIGTSYNYYDQNEGKWFQRWIDKNGGVLNLEGTFNNGKMTLYSKVNFSQGKTILNRISWTPQADGTVIQHWEITQDGGDSWNTLFYGIYSRVKE